MGRRKIPPLNERNQSNNYGLSEPYIDRKRSKDGEFIAYYTYWKSDGTIGPNNTSKFRTEKAAIKEAKERQKKSHLLLLEEKKKEDADIKTKAEYTIERCLDEYIEYLDSRKHIRSSDAKSVNRSNWDLARQLKSKHFDPEIRYKKLKDIEEEDFAEWLGYINSQPYEKNKTSGLYAGETVLNMRKILKKFAQYLEDNRYFYFDKGMPDRLKDKLSKRQIRKKKSGAREDLNVPTYEDVKKLVSKYDRTTFFGEYCYCLFMFMFFSGCRISEIINIQIKDIDWEEGEIHIKNSAHQREGREAVMEDLKNGRYKTKTKNSERYIPMMDSYYRMLKTYFERYKDEFPKDELFDRKRFTLAPAFINKINKMEEFSDKRFFADAFLFPKLQTRYDNREEKGIFVYQTAKWVNEELARACKANGLPRYSCLSFRHACAHFLAYDLRLLEGEAVDLFGHGDDGTILKDIYAELEPMEKCKRLKQRHTNIFHRNIKAERRKEREGKERIRNLVKGYSLEEKQKEIETINMQKLIEKNIAEGYHCMYYTRDKAEIIYNLCQKFHYEKKIHLIMVE